MLIELLKVFIIRGTWCNINGDIREGKKSFAEALDIIEHVSRGRNSLITQYLHKKAGLAAPAENNRQQAFKASEGSTPSNKTDSSDEEVILTDKSPESRGIITTVIPSDEEIAFAISSIRPLINVLACFGSDRIFRVRNLSKSARVMYREISPLIHTLFELKEEFSLAKLSKLPHVAYETLQAKLAQLVIAFEQDSLFSEQYPARDFLQAYLLEAYLLRDNISLLSTKKGLLFSLKISSYYANLAAAYTEIYIYHQAVNGQHEQAPSRYPIQEQNNALKDRAMLDSLNDNARRYLYRFHRFECKIYLYRFEQTIRVNEKAKHYIRAIDELDKVYQCMSAGFIPFFNLLCKIGSLTHGLPIPDAQYDELLCTDLAKHLTRLSQIYGDMIDKLQKCNMAVPSGVLKPDQLIALFSHYNILVNKKVAELQQELERAIFEKTKIETAAAITEVELFLSEESEDSNESSRQGSKSDSLQSSDSSSPSLTPLPVFDEETNSSPPPLRTVNSDGRNLDLLAVEEKKLTQDDAATDDESVKDIGELTENDVRLWIEYVARHGGVFQTGQCKRHLEQASGVHFIEGIQQGTEQSAVSLSVGDCGHIIKRGRGTPQASC